MAGWDWLGADSILLTVKLGISMGHAARKNTGRYVSRLTSGTLAVVMAGGRGERLKALTQHRCKPATPFGGKFRIIDFVLSNCVNSGIRQIAVLTQYKAQSLIQHIHRGWSYLRGELGEFVELIPAQQQIGPHWYRGTADSVYQNLDFIRSHHPTHVLILAGDHIYKMDYGPMIAYHEQCEADITVGVVDVPLERANEFGILTTDDTNRVTKFAEKPNDPDPIIGQEELARASMGIYVIGMNRLEKMLTDDAANESSKIIGATWVTSTPCTKRTWNWCRSIRNSTSTIINGLFGRTRGSNRPRNSCWTRKAGAVWRSTPWSPAAASSRAPM